VLVIPETGTQKFVDFILLGARLSPPKEVTNVVHSESAGTCHPEGASFPVCTAYQLYNFPYLVLFESALSVTANAPIESAAHAALSKPVGIAVPSLFRGF